MTSEATPKRRLRTLLTLPFIALIVTPSLVIALSSLYTGLSAVDTLSERIITDVSSRVEQAAVHQMEEAAITLRSTMPDPSDSLGGAAAVFADLSSIEKKLFELTAATRTTSYIYYGAEDGAFVGVDRGRVGARSAATVRVRTGAETFRRIYASRTSDDRSRLLETETRVYDARTRQWYRNAKEENHLTWTPVYVSFASGSLVTTASQPVTRDGRLLGVLAADVELSELSMFMKTVSVSDNGVAFIVDREGYLVASSAPGLPFKDTAQGQERVLVAASTTLIERDVATWLQGLPRSTTSVRETQPTNRASMIQSAKIQASLGGAVDVAVRPISRINGVEWDVVVAIPRSDLTDPIVRSSAIMFFVIVAALAAALQLAMWIVRRVATDVDQLVRAANDYAADGKEFAAPNTTLHETSELASAFVGMFGRLRDSLWTIRRQNEDLAALNATLEERVEQRTRQLESKNVELTAEIGRRGKLEVDLRNASEAAVKQADDKVRFMAMLGHELRTPLQAVIGASEILSRADAVSASDARETGVLKAASKSVLALVDGVLSYAKLEAGKVEPQYSTFMLKEVTQEACDVVAASDPTSRTTISIDIDRTAPDFIKTDAGVYRQILINLIANAMKHAPHARIAVAVTAKPLYSGADVGAVATDDAITLHVSVSDDGAGIPAEHRSKLFQPFQQVGRGAADPSRGSGLGLAICALLTKTLGGEISIDETRERGTSICFWIRAQRGSPDTQTTTESLIAATNATQPDAVDIARRSLRVLLVDDHVVNLRLVGEMLRVLGHDVVRVQSGEAAVDAMRTALQRYGDVSVLPQTPAFDVVLMDLNLPGMSGFEAVLALRELCKASSAIAPMFVALTASTDDDDRVRCIETGMVERITKPATLATLNATLQRVQVTPRVLDPKMIDRRTDDVTVLSVSTIEQLIEIEKKGGQPFVASLIRDYLAGMDAELQVIFDALSRRDTSAVRRATHALAGASLSVGAAGLATVLRENEGCDETDWRLSVERMAHRTRDELARFAPETGEFDR